MTDTDLPVARAERLALCATFDLVGPDAPTLNDGWLTRDLAAHLVVRERRPDAAAGIFVPWLASHTESVMEGYAAKPWPELVDLVRQGPPAWSPTRLSAVDDLVNTAEMTVHHEDVLRADGRVGPRRAIPERLSRETWTLLGRAGRLLAAKAKPTLVLTAPGHGTVTVHHGGEQVVLTGAPVELLLVLYGRGEVAEVDVDGSPAAVAAYEASSFGM